MARYVIISIVFLLCSCAVIGTTYYADYVFGSGGVVKDLGGDVEASYGFGQSIIRNHSSTSFHAQEGIYYVGVAFTVSEVIAATPTPTPTPSPGGGATTPHLENFILYDVVIRLHKMFYHPGDTIYANITIINKGDIPDADAIMQSWLQDGPDGKKRLEFAQETRFEIPAGSKRSLSDGKYIPNDVDIGEWCYVVQYHTEAMNDAVLGITCFQVLPTIGTQEYMIIAAFALLGYMGWNYRKKRQ